MNLGPTTSGFESLAQLVSQAANKCGVSVRIHDELIRNSDHYNFAVAGIPAVRIIAGFGEQDSKLRHVLTSCDTRSLVSADELDNAFQLTMSIVQEAEGI